MIGVGKSLLMATLLCQVQAEPTGSIEGTVKDRDGHGVAGAAVFAYRITDDEVRLEQQIASDGEGHYGIIDLAPGEYAVEFRNGPASSLVRSQELWSELLRRLSAMGTPVNVSPQIQKRMQENVRRDIDRLRDEHAHVIVVGAGSTAVRDLVYPRDVAVDLTVLGPHGPIRGAPVRLLWQDRQGLPGRDRPPEQPKGQTNAAGHLTFEIIPEGTYIAVVEAFGWELSMGVHEIRGLGTVPLRLELGPYRIRFKVVDAHGEPIRSVEAAIYKTGEHSVSVCRPGFKDLSELNGTYEIPFAQEGEYGVHVKVGSGSAGVRGIQVGPENPCPEVVVTMPGMGSIRVKIVDASGTPQSGVQVRLQFKDGIPGYGYPSGEDGERLFKNLKEGVWQVGLSGLWSLTQFGGDPVEVEVKAFETTEVTLVVPDDER